MPPSPGQHSHPIPSSLPSVPLGDGALPATSTMSPGTMSRARILCTPLRSARITFPISGSYSFKASMALSAFLSCKKQRSRAAAGGHQSGEAPSSCRDGCTPTPTPPSAPIGTTAGERAMPSRAAPACSEIISAGLNHNSSWTPPGSLALVFSLLVWEAVFPT